MPDVQAHFQQITQKVQQLLKLQDQTLRENEKLAAEVATLKQQLDNALLETNQLKEQVEILQTTTGKMDEASKKAFDKRINQYIKDIDKVIAHLNTNL